MKLKNKLEGLSTIGNNPIEAQGNDLICVRMNSTMQVH